MQTFIEKYIEQGERLGEQRGEQRGEAKMLLRQIERKFCPPSEPVRIKIAQADPDRLLEWSERMRLPDQVPDGIRLRVLVLMEDNGHDDASAKPAVRSRRKPSPRLAGSIVMHDDLIKPAAPEDDWNALP